jgi:hypothetical protein
MTTETLRRGIRIGRTGRVLLGLWCLFLVAGFSTAAMLSPDPRGFGTHQRLGLPPCTIRVLSGVRCPTCGMTTSFANFVRGRFAASARANAAGFCLAWVCAVQLPWCVVSLRRGKLWGVEQPDRWLLSILGGLLALSLLQWAAWMWLE